MPTGRTTPVEDPQDPRVADYVGLTDVARRHAVERGGGGRHGFLVAEGAPVVRRAAAAGLRCRSLLLLPGREDLVDDVVAGLAADVPVLVAGADVLAEVTGFPVHRGVLAAFDRPAPRDPAAVLADARHVVICEELSSSTNLGAVVRSVAALGVDGLLLDPRCADPYYRRAVRVSMGQVFTLPHARLEPWPAALDQVRAAGLQVWALTPGPGAEPLDALVPLPPTARVALLLGAEGPGLSARALAAADRRVAIPMARGVDSLNVAAAAAVAGWALTRGGPAHA